jgi:archaellum biogenesis ATPase FlaH
MPEVDSAQPAQSKTINVFNPEMQTAVQTVYPTANDILDNLYEPLQQINIPLITLSDAAFEDYKEKIHETGLYDPILLDQTDKNVDFLKALEPYKGKQLLIDEEFAVPSKIKEFKEVAIACGCKVGIIQKGLHKTVTSGEFQYLDQAITAVGYKDFVPALKSDANTELKEPTPEYDDLEDNAEDFLKIWDCHTFSQLPLQEYYIDGIIPKGGVVIAYGDSGSGKSFFVSDMCAHICTNTKYLGRDVEQTKILYICAEGAVGYRGRIKALLAKFPHMKAVDFCIIADSPDFSTKKDLKLLRQRIKESAQYYGIIVVDTMAQVSAEVDENSSVVRKVVKIIASLAIDSTTVIIIDHTGKEASKGIRGHSSKRAAADVTISLQTSGKKGSDMRMATLVKAKEDEDNTPICTFKLKNVIIGHKKNGKIKESCVIDLMNPMESYVPATAIEFILHTISTENYGKGITEKKIKSLRPDWITESNFSMAMKKARGEVAGGENKVFTKDGKLNPKFVSISKMIAPSQADATVDNAKWVLCAMGEKNLLDAEMKHTAAFIAKMENEMVSGDDEDEESQANNES